MTSPQAARRKNDKKRKSPEDRFFDALKGEKCTLVYWDGASLQKVAIQLVWVSHYCLGVRRIVGQNPQEQIDLWYKKYIHSIEPWTE